MQLVWAFAEFTVDIDWLRHIVWTVFAPLFAWKLTVPGSSSPGVIVANTHSVGASLAVWLAAGLLAWTGASSFAELGYVAFIPVTFTLDSVILRSSIPLDGGPQAYLSYAYGPLVSYLFSWTAISALKPGLWETPVSLSQSNPHISFFELRRW